MKKEFWDLDYKEKVESIKNGDLFERDMFGEPLLHSLIYEYRSHFTNIENGTFISTEFGLVSHTEMLGKIKNAIEIILFYIDKTTVNLLGLNKDSAIMVAAERPCTVWIMQKLLKKNPNLSVINDINEGIIQLIERCKNERAKITLINYFFSPHEIQLAKTLNSVEWVNYLWEKVKKMI